MGAQLDLPKLELGEVAVVAPDGSEAIAYDDAIIFVSDSEDWEVTVKGPAAYRMAKNIVSICNSHLGRQRAIEHWKGHASMLEDKLEAIRRIVAKSPSNAALAEIGDLAVQALNAERA